MKRSAWLVAAWIGAAGAVGAAGAGPLDRSPAPRFHMESLEGEPLALDSLRSRGPVILDFWATWCKPCAAASAGLEDLYRRYAPNGVTVVGISVDGPRNFSKVRPFVREHGLTFPIALDEDGDLQNRLQVQALPTTVLVDTAGFVVWRVEGFRPGEGRELEASLRDLLGLGPGDSSGTPPAIAK